MRWFAALRAMCSICGNSADFFYCLSWFDTVEFNCLPSPSNDVRWCGFCYSIPLSIDYVWNLSIDRLYRLLHAHIAYEIDTAEIIAAFCRISYCLRYLIRLNSIVCMIKQQDIRWFGFCWSIPISIWSVYIDRAISTPWYSDCKWNSYIKNHHW